MNTNSNDKRSDAEKLAMFKEEMIMCRRNEDMYAYSLIPYYVKEDIKKNEVSPEKVRD